ncbi:hypothetical protein LTR05_004373 [Lithohypha guttulata]|uniref:Uncharacterized protein n=1 Tax=Lithohypha guttulata TaxID=1690604 RepID=A0AAN7T1D5_9EURO|nr:hypothetical protein LTR05_004373 [Lithohypha guttulata]
MPSITPPDFDQTTEARTVAAAFPEHIQNRVILITGVNRKGIGYATAEAFASQQPATLILAGRSPPKVQECMDALKQNYPRVNYRSLIVDLSSQHSVRSAATEVLNWNDTPTIDLLVNNAAAMWIPQRTLTPEGIELTLATNHVGHFLLTNLIMPKLLAAAKTSPPGAVRIVNVSSSATWVSPPRWSDLSWSNPALDIPENERQVFQHIKAAGIKQDGEVVNEAMSYIPIAAYAHSKTANILFTVGLNQRLHAQHGILSVALNPGEVQTELARNFGEQEWFLEARQRFLVKTPEAGAATSVVAALDPGLNEASKDIATALFLSDCRPGKAPAYAVDAENAERLWKITEDWVGEEFTFS